MANELELSEAMQRFITRTVPRRADMVKRATALDLQSRLIQATPVDIGYARANWRATRDEVELELPPRPTKGEQLEAPTVADLAPSDNPNSTLYVSNNVPYIGELNDGHSAQAPAGFVDATLAASTDFFETLARQVIARDGGP